TTYRRYAKDGTCNTTPEQSTGEWTVMVEPTPVAGVFISNPAAFTTVCEGTLVWATLDGNTGGNGTDQTEYRVFTPTSYSVWMPYDGSPLSTNGLLVIELRSRRLSDYCSPSPWIHSGWTVEPTPVSGILQRQPDVAMVCEGSTVQAMLTGADGGNWTDQTEYRTRTTGGWSSWMPYAGTAINTTGLLEVDIRSRRLADYCQPSAYTTVKWDVEPTPVSGILTASPAQALVCEGTEVSAQLQPGAGGNGVDVTEYRTKQSDSWSSWMPYASGQFLSTLGIQRIELRTVRTASVCSNAMANTVSWDIEQPAQAGCLIKTPMQAMVCEGSEVSALLQTPGAGGNGTDQAVYRSRSGAVWSEWMPYTLGTPLSTSGLDEIEIGTRRLATACPSSDYQTAIWQVEPTPVAFAGNNAVSCSNQAYALQAQAFHATGYQWISSGDGSFSNPAQLNPEYMPGPQDKASGTVTLTLTVNTQGLCQASSSMTLTLTQPVTPVVTVTPNVPTVCSGTPVQYAATYQHAGSSPVFVWKVNGQAVPGSGPNFANIPQQGDAVSVEMTTSLGCVTQATVQSNNATVNVVPISLNLSTNPVAGGQASYTGQLALGGAVQLSATPAFGYVFLHWTDQSGQVVGTTPELQYTLQTCITALTANFVPGATLSGYLKFYNPIESPVSATGAHFMAQLFKDNAAVSVPQPFNADGYYSFSPIIQGGGYTLRVWEQPPVNQLSSTWMWNNWAGVSGLDGLIVSFMATEQPLSQAFPWIQPVHNVPYTPFAVTTADVNNTSTITANDALTILYRSVQGSAFGTFPGNRHNFILSASRLTNPSVMRYPQAPELMFEPFGMYQAAQPASQVYYEVDPGAMTAGNNYMNIYLTAAGDMNASYLPGNNLKTTASLLYEGTMQKKAGDAFDLPVFLTSEVLLGAATIGLRYDSEMLEVKQVRGATVQHIDDKEGVVRTAWYDTRGMMFDPSMPVLNLSVVLRREPGVGSRYLELLPETEFADVDARVIDKLQLRTLSLTGQDNATGEVAINHQVVPNPFTDQARLSFSLPEQGRVTVMIYNQFGQLVKQLAEQQFRAGQHSINIHKKDLIHSGTYYYQLHHDTGSKSTVVSGKLIMIR
ncbi:MAG: T9SS type A sorting domain-containing protein, partial [Bacteroidia bacterium]|nr:T9SS type A sorting domain-containing protein [Bacteroidia bacterium]